MNEDTGPVKVNGEVDQTMTPEQYKQLVDQQKMVGAAQYQQNVDTAMLDWLASIDNNLDRIRGWLAFLGILVIIGLVLGVLLGGCSLLM